MMDSARGTIASGTRRMAVAADIVQKPPIAMPSNTRPSRTTVRLGANATSRFEPISSTEKANRTKRRSVLRVITEMARLVTSAIAAVAVTGCPAMPSVTPMLDAIAVRRLAGRNSAVMRPNTPRVIAKTAPQAAGASSGAASAASTQVFMSLPSNKGENGRLNVERRTVYDAKSSIIDHASNHEHASTRTRPRSRPGQRTAPGHAPVRRPVPADRGGAAFRCLFRFRTGASPVPLHRTGARPASHRRRHALSATDRRRVADAAGTCAHVALIVRRPLSRHHRVRGHTVVRQREGHPPGLPRRYERRRRVDLQRVHGIRTGWHAAPGHVDAGSDASRHLAGQVSGTAADPRCHGARIPGEAGGFC